MFSETSQTEQLFVCFSLNNFHRNFMSKDVSAQNFYYCGFYKISEPDVQVKMAEYCHS